MFYQATTTRQLFNCSAQPPKPTHTPTAPSKDSCAWWDRVGFGAQGEHVMQPNDTQFPGAAHRQYDRYGAKPSVLRYAVATEFENPAVWSTPRFTISTAGSQPSLIGVAMQPYKCRIRPNLASREENLDRRGRFVASVGTIQGSAIFRALKTRRGAVVSTPLRPVNAFPTRGPPKMPNALPTSCRPIVRFRTQDDPSSHAGSTPLF